MGEIVEGRGVVFILGQSGVLLKDSLDIFRITLRKSFRWKKCSSSWLLKTCTVMSTIDLIPEKLFVNYINI